MRSLVTVWLSALLARGGHLSSTAPQSASVQEAAARFDRGVELYGEGDHAAAATEFRRAYELAPNHRILYDLGQAAYQQHDYVAARDAFVRYLREGGPRVPKKRRREVQAEIERLGQRIGQLDVFVDEAEAEVMVDDVTVGRSPLVEPLVLAVGPHRLAVVGRSGSTAAKRVEVFGGGHVAVRFQLPPLAPVVVPNAIAPAVEPPPALRALSERRSDAESAHPPGPRYAWIGWATAGLLGVGAGVAGVVALGAARERDRLQRSYPADAKALDGTQRRLRIAALTTDLLGLGAGLAVGVTLAIPLFGAESEGETRDSADALRVDLTLAPGRVGLGGHF